MYTRSDDLDLENGATLREFVNEVLKRHGDGSMMAVAVVYISTEGFIGAPLVAGPEITDIVRPLITKAAMDIGDALCSAGILERNTAFPTNQKPELS
jgi:hypothetical protein